MRFLYTCFTCFYAIPLAFVIFLMRPFSRLRDIERLGVSLPENVANRRPIWLVASSVGEVTIALKLIERLKSLKSIPVILSVTTSTGRAHANNSTAKPDVVVYHPFDLPTFVRKSIAHFHTALIVLIETEFWPVFMAHAFEQGIPVALVSGRISRKSLGRYRAMRPLFAPLLQRCSLLLMQSDEDAAHVAEISQDASNIEVIGSIKEDYVPPSQESMTEVKARFKPWDGNAILACGSTRPGEEEILADAFAQLREQFPKLRLVVAPRHLERTSEVKRILSERDLQTALWTDDSLSDKSEVLVLDTIGNLNAVYHISDIAFVGGTLVPVGGHNLLEPALAGCPVLHGPHLFLQRRGHQLLSSFEMDHPVTSVADIAATVSTLLHNQNRRAEYKAKAASLRQSSSHILSQYAEKILALVPDE